MAKNLTSEFSYKLATKTTVKGRKKTFCEGGGRNLNIYVEFVFYLAAVIEILNLKINQDLSSAAFSKQQIFKSLY